MKLLHFLSFSLLAVLASGAVANGAAVKARAVGSNDEDTKQTPEEQFLAILDKVFNDHPEPEAPAFAKRSGHLRRDEQFNSCGQMCIEQNDCHGSCSTCDSKTWICK